MQHEQVEQVYSESEIAEAIRGLAAKIRSDAGNSEVFLLGILKGASCFLADLLRAIPGPVGYGFIDVIRDENDTATAAALEIDFISYTSVTGRNVYVLKDVVSSGVIEAYLVSQLRIHNPASVRLVALLDRAGTRKVDLATDYRAFEAGDGRFVGYGLEIEGRHANLPFIGRIPD